MCQIHTLLIPTYNRPEMLRSLLTHLVNSPLQLKVLDSSAPAIQLLNEQFIKRHSRIQHCRYPTETLPSEKWTDGIKRVQTPYFSFLADDDFVFADAIQKSVELLENKPEAVAAHGIYFKFGYEKAKPHSIAVSLEYSGESIQGDSANARLVQLMNHYESPMYAVYRTNVMREMIPGLLKFSNTGYVELFQAVASVLAGKVLRIREPYNARRDGPNAEANRRHCDPWTWMGEDPYGLFQAYLPYRQAVLDWWRNCDDTISAEEMAKWCDSAHYLYLCKSVGPAQLYHYNFKLPFPTAGSHPAFSDSETARGTKERLTRIFWRERPWRRPIYNLARLFRKVANKVVQYGEDHAAVPPTNPLALCAEYPVHLAENLRTQGDFPQLAPALQAIREYVKLDSELAKVAA
jgi:glycosyltransferase domain-containing protein